MMGSVVGSVVGSGLGVVMGGGVGVGCFVGVKVVGMPRTPRWMARGSWSFWVWWVLDRMETVLEPFVLRWLRGTGMLKWIASAAGCEVGDSVCLEGSRLSLATGDRVSFGPGCRVERGSLLVAARVRSNGVGVSDVRIPARGVVGPGSCVLGEGSKVETCAASANGDDTGWMWQAWCLGWLVCVAGVVVEMPWALPFVAVGAARAERVVGRWVSELWLGVANVVVMRFFWGHWVYSLWLWAWGVDIEWRTASVIGIREVGLGMRSVSIREHALVGGYTVLDGGSLGAVVGEGTFVANTGVVGPGLVLCGWNILAPLTRGSAKVVPTERALMGDLVWPSQNARPAATAIPTESWVGPLIAPLGGLVCGFLGKAGLVACMERWGVCLGSGLWMGVVTVCMLGMNALCSRVLSGSTRYELGSVEGGIWSLMWVHVWPMWEGWVGMFWMGTAVFPGVMRAMGGEVAWNAQIFSTRLTDVEHLEIGRSSVVEVDASLIGHSLERKGLNVGMGVTCVGAGSVVAPRAVVLDRVVVGDRVVFSGLGVSAFNYRGPGRGSPGRGHSGLDDGTEIVDTGKVVAVYDGVPAARA